MILPAYVVDDARDAQRPGEAQQVSYEAEGDAQEQGPPKSLLHCPPDPPGATGDSSALFLHGGEKASETEK